MPRTIRVDQEVYCSLLRAKHLLEEATQQVQSMRSTVSFLMALHLEEGVDTLYGKRHTLIYEEEYHA